MAGPDLDLIQKMSFLKGGGDPYRDQKETTYQGIAKVLKSVQGIADWYKQNKAKKLYRYDETSGKFTEIPGSEGISKDQTFETKPKEPKITDYDKMIVIDDSKSKLSGLPLGATVDAKTYVLAVQQNNAKITAAGAETRQGKQQSFQSGMEAKKEAASSAKEKQKSLEADKSKKIKYIETGMSQWGKDNPMPAESTYFIKSHYTRDKAQYDTDKSQEQKRLANDYENLKNNQGGSSTSNQFESFQDARAAELPSGTVVKVKVNGQYIPARIP